ncbi:metallophosphoesterase [Halobacteriales archaeon QS_5_70_17]|nr:MAG: metallophosphoesterase [Halobacteriales archaeon QS_5_70_17]
MSDPGYRLRDRALVLPAADALVLADLHVGMDAESGVEFPLGERDDLVGRLRALLDAVGPGEVVFGGDLLHSFSSVPAAVPDTVAALERTVRAAGARPVVTPGNHDTMLPSVWDGPTAEEYRLDDGTVVCHGHERPSADADRYVIGHDHPAITVEGQRHPCYLRGEFDGSEVVVLPAFTRLAAGTTVEGRRAGGFQSPLITDADALRPVVWADGETYEFPPLGEFRGML